MTDAPPVTRLVATKGDITAFAVDAIVNAANESLRGGGGVDGAIHRAAGPGLLEECRRIGSCPTGEARLTRGHNLPARYVIHAVGPIWRGGDDGEDRQLESCYRAALAIARENRFNTLAFPAISTGVYRFPLARATAIAVRAVADTVMNAPDMHVTFVCFDDAALAAYRAELSRLA